MGVGLGMQDMSMQKIDNESHADRKVVLVDDEESILKMLRIALGASGYTAYCFMDGKDALKAMAEEDIHVVFTDLRMPSMDGMTLCRRALEQDPRAQVFAVSAYIRRFTDAQYAEAGFAGQFTKPFRIDELIAACDSAFARLEASDPG